MGKMIGNSTIANTNQPKVTNRTRNTKNPGIANNNKAAMEKMAMLAMIMGKFFSTVAGADCGLPAGGVA